MKTKRSEGEFLLNRHALGSRREMRVPPVERLIFPILLPVKHSEGEFPLNSTSSGGGTGNKTLVGGHYSCLRVKT